MISTTDAKSKTTTMAYDAMNRLVSTTDRLSGVTTSAYDKNSNLTSLTDSESQTTTYAYSVRNERISETYPDHTSGTSSGDAGYGIVETAFDEAGRPLRRTDQKGDTITTVYDMASRVLSRDYRLKANSPSGTIADQDTFYL